MTPKIPPNSPEAEKAVLGSILISGESIKLVQDMLLPGDFYFPHNATIYEAMIQLQRKKMPIDLKLVVSALQDAGKLDEVGGVSYVAELTLEVPTASYLRQYASVVKDKAILRRLVLAGDIITKLGYNESLGALESLIEAEKCIVGVQNLQLFDELEKSDVKNILDDVLEEREGGHEKGVSTGIAVLDNATKRLRKGHFWILGGYCLGKGTLVHMEDGTMKPVEKINVGDRLLPVFKNKDSVVSAISSGREKMFEINGKGFDSYTANKGHILPLVWVGDGYKNLIRGNVYNITIEDFVKKSLRERRGYRLFRTVAEFGSDIPENMLHPYMLGLWLGDGCVGSSSIVVSKNEKEIIDYLKTYAKKFSHECKFNEYKKDGVLIARITGKQGGDVSIRGNSLRKELLKAGVFEKKHIPKRYMLASSKSRLALLAGLIDTDGCTSGASGSCSVFYNVDFDLIFQVKLLAESLGFRTHLAKKKQAVSKLVPSSGKGFIWRLTITGNTYLIPNKVLRKKAKKLRFPKHCFGEKTIFRFTLKDIGEGNYYGFVIGGNHLFFAQNYIVNHNTNVGKTGMMLQLINNVCATGNAAMLFTLEMKSVDIVDRLLQFCEWKIKNKNIALDTVAGYDLKVFAQKTRLNDIIRTIRFCRPRPPVVFIDFLQLIQCDGKTEYERLTRIAQDLQNAAKELDVCIVGLSQISNEGAKSNDSVVISFKGSGALAIACDVGIELSRDKEVSGGEWDDIRMNVRKNRHGPRPDTKYNFDKKSGFILFN